jgi:hypothetical protein
MNGHSFGKYSTGIFIGVFEALSVRASHAVLANPRWSGANSGPILAPVAAPVRFPRPSATRKARAALPSAARFTADSYKRRVPSP